MKAVVAAFNQEKALVGAFSVITNLRMELFGALVKIDARSIELRDTGSYGFLLPPSEIIPNAEEAWAFHVVAAQQVIQEFSPKTTASS